jgi:hypothetical protein
MATDLIRGSLFGQIHSDQLGCIQQHWHKLKSPCLAILNPTSDTTILAFNSG